MRADLESLRRAALSGEPTAAIRDRVQAQLRRWIARTERPAGSGPATTDSSTGPTSVQAKDFTGFLALRRVAEEVKAPLTVEYWKSAPYFLNFSQRLQSRGKGARQHEDSWWPGPVDATAPRRTADREIRRGAVPATRVGERSDANSGIRDS